MEGKKHLISEISFKSGNQLLRENTNFYIDRRN